MTWSSPRLQIMGLAYRQFQQIRLDKNPLSSFTGFPFFPVPDGSPTYAHAQQLSYQGLSLEQYMQFTGMTPDVMKEQIKPQALKRIQSRLVLEAVVAAEGIEVSDEQFDEEIKKMAETYQMEEDKLKELMGEREKESITLDIAVQKAVEMVVEEAKEA